jgi:hypothetical protein
VKAGLLPLVALAQYNKKELRNIKCHVRAMSASHPFATEFRHCAPTHLLRELPQALAQLNLQSLIAIDANVPKSKSRQAGGLSRTTY